MIILGILVDTLQPPHLGVKQAYDAISKARGPQYAYIAVTERKHDIHSDMMEPMSRSDKQQILVKHGILKDRLLDSKSLFDTSQLESSYDPNDTAVVFYFFSGKGTSNFSHSDKVLAWSEAYASNPQYQAQLKPMGESVYYSILNDSIRRVKGLDLSTKLFIDEIGNPQNSEDNKKTFFALAFGWYDAGHYNLVKERFHKPYEMMVSKYSKAVNQPSIEKSIDEITEAMVEDLTASLSSDLPPEEKTPSQIAADKTDNIQNLRMKRKTLDLTKKQSDSDAKANKEKVRQLSNDYNKSKQNISRGIPVDAQISQTKN
jgi:hypothetical protein